MLNVQNVVTTSNENSIISGTNSISTPNGNIVSNSTIVYSGDNSYNVFTVKVGTTDIVTESE